MTTRGTEAPRPNIVARTAPRIGGRFIQEVVAELRKVVWPTREEATRLTVMVLTVSIAVGVVLGVFDFGFSQAIRRLFNPS